MLSPKEYELIEAMVNRNDKSVQTVCDEQGITRQAYYQKLKQKPEFKAHMQKLQEQNKAEAINLFKGYALTMAQIIVSIANGTLKGATKLRFDAARDALDRAGVGSTLKIQPEREDKQPEILSIEEVRKQLSLRQEAKKLVEEMGQGEVEVENDN